MNAVQSSSCYSNPSQLKDIEMNFIKSQIMFKNSMNFVKRAEKVLQINCEMETNFEPLIDYVETKAAFHFDEANIVSERVGVAVLVLVAESLTFAVNGMCFLFSRCHLHPSVIGSAGDEFAAGCWHEAALESGA